MQAPCLPAYQGPGCEAKHSDRFQTFRFLHSSVSREFTLVDKTILEEEGTSLPEQGRGRRKRKKRKLESHVDSKRGVDSERLVVVDVV